MKLELKAALQTLAVVTTLGLAVFCFITWPWSFLIGMLVGMIVLLYFGILGDLRRDKFWKETIDRQTKIFEDKIDKAAGFDE